MIPGIAALPSRRWTIGPMVRQDLEVSIAATARLHLTLGEPFLLVVPAWAVPYSSSPAGAESVCSRSSSS
ncbi:MAG: hypothetical protein H6527_01135 [Actinobacteria bacterium]|nr:hypothetical protein [Actinomycetota bacterium]